jgi:hypothetical protein
MIDLLFAGGIPQCPPIRRSQMFPAYPVSLRSEHSVQTRTVDSRLSARGLTALRLNHGNVFLKKKFYFPYHICLNVLYASQC